LEEHTAPIFKVEDLNYFFIPLFNLFVVYLTTLPNVMVEWLVLPLRIREVADSNLGPETGCPEGFVVFLSPTM
jgi:hypothetical protein